MKRIFLFIMGMAMMLSAQADELVVNNETRSYNVYAPQNLGEKRPLLIFCHGFNQDANWIQNSEFKNDNVSMEAVCDTAKFVVVFPNGINKGWDLSGDRDINFIKAIIDKMVTQYNIDRNRVYLGGFSMGGMLTYHAMNRIPDLIAAFCPVSGYPMGGATANANVRPLPILHIHGTGDDVCAFSGAQPALNVWINHNGCPTTAKVTNNYNGFNGCKMHVWGPGNQNVEVRLLELPNKGHWICKEPQIYTGKEIWNFCKRFTSEQKDPIVKVTAPKDGLTYLAFGGAVEVPAITMTATASDPDGTVAKVAFYDNDELLKEFTAAPYSYAISNLQKGTHVLKAVATDDEGRTGKHTVTVIVDEPDGNYKMYTTYAAAGSVPEGWTTYDGSEKRVGFSSGFGSGSRLFQFTGEKHDFDMGLYTRNVNGNAKAGYARFADTGTSTTMMLYPGQYRIYAQLANWNCADFSPVTIAVETVGGKTVAETTVTPTSNIGNSASNSFEGTTRFEYNFEVNEKGRHVVTFYTADAPWADLVVGRSWIKWVGPVTGISDAERLVNSEEGMVNHKTYDLQGRLIKESEIRHSELKKGLYIVNGKKMAVRK